MKSLAVNHAVHRTATFAVTCIKNIFSPIDLVDLEKPFCHGHQQPADPPGQCAHSDKPVTLYDLDVVISVGYRVKSPQGVQFGRWATQRLRDYLIQGYALTQKRFEENAAELKQALALIQKAARSPALATDMGRGLVDIMGRYTTTFLWLQQYDEGLLKEQGGFPGGILPRPGPID